MEARPNYSSDAIRCLNFKDKIKFKIGPKILLKRNTHEGRRYSNSNCVLVKAQKTFVFLVLCIYLLSLAKLETVEFYNETNYGVDVTDQMARQYSVKAGSRRWPLAAFYNILDLAGINAFVLYKKANR